MGERSRTKRLLLAAGLAVMVGGALMPGAANAGEQGAQDAQIVGGTRASIADHSYAVYLATPEGFPYCGGTLVARTKVITAAHCVVGKQAKEVVVVAGREDKESSAGAEVKLAELWVHPDYADVRSGNDIAVLTLAKRLDYKTLELAGAADVELYKAGTLTTVLGWGRTAENGPPSRFLLQATVPVIDDAGCRTSYSAFSAQAMMCAGLPEGGVDTCQGDSGGPLVVAGKLVGITSWGEGCALPGKPGVYTRVSSYADVLSAQL